MFKLIFLGHSATQAPMVSRDYKHEQHLRNAKYTKCTISTDISKFPRPTFSLGGKEKVFLKENRTSWKNPWPDNLNDAITCLSNRLIKVTLIDTTHNRSFKNNNHTSKYNDAMLYVVNYCSQFFLGQLYCVAKSHNLFFNFADSKKLFKKRGGG